MTEKIDLIEVNTRVKLPDDVHRRLKVRAINERKTLDQLVRELLTAGIETAPKK